MSICSIYKQTLESGVFECEFGLKNAHKAKAP
jgi:hypothetical protein